MPLTEAKRNSHRENMRRRYHSDPIHRMKQKARSVVSRAVLRGKLVKLSCEKCGNLKSQGHHYDYAKPLEVKWLCKKCHESEHGGRGFHG